MSSLRSLGVVESVISNKEIVREGEPLKVDTLLDILAFAEKEIEEGNFFALRK